MTRSRLLRLQQVRGSRPCAGMVALALGTLWAGWLVAAEPAAAPATLDPNSLVGARVDVTLTNGETLANVELLKISLGTVAGTVRSVTIPDATTGKPLLLGAVRIQEISRAGGKPILVYDRRQRVLAPPTSQADVEKPDAAEKPGSKKQPGSPHKTTDAEHEAWVEKERGFLEEVRQKVPNDGLRLYETKRFLFFSDIPTQLITNMYVPYLDKMYTTLCGAYGIDPGTNIWKGKAAIVAFAAGRGFQEFENTFYHRAPPPNVQGVAHCSSSGAVVIGCHAGNDPKYFAVVLVHETAHGFTNRYSAGHRVPSWLNEGISEWIANQVIPGNRGIPQKIERAIQQMRLTRSLGGDFFTVEHVKDWQYGAAASMAEFLLHYDPKPQRPVKSHRGKQEKVENRCFRKLLEGIRDGVPWEQSLQDAYGMTPAELAEAYGQSLGIPGLRP